MAFTVAGSVSLAARSTPSFQPARNQNSESRREAVAGTRTRGFFGASVSKPAAAAATAVTFEVMASDKPTLFSAPVSNFAARCRHLVYAKGLDVEIKSPADLGGLKSEEYMKINPLGKMPALITADGMCLFESEVINGYLLDKFAQQGESFRPASPEARAYAALIVRYHDVYMGPVQGCMYKDGIEPDVRRKQLDELLGHLSTLDTLIGKAPGFASHGLIGGPNLSQADVAVYPTFVFYTHILPKHFGVDPFQGRPNLQRWWNTVKQDSVAQKVIAEVQSGLDGWEKNDRWGTVLKNYK